MIHRFVTATVTRRLTVMAMVIVMVAVIVMAIGMVTSIVIPLLMMIQSECKMATVKVMIVKAIVKETVTLMVCQ